MVIKKKNLQTSAHLVASFKSLNEKMYESIDGVPKTRRTALEGTASAPTSMGGDGSYASGEDEVGRKEVRATFLSQFAFKI